MNDKIFVEFFSGIEKYFIELQELQDVFQEEEEKSKNIFGFSEQGWKVFKKQAQSVVRVNDPDVFHSGISSLLFFMEKNVNEPEVEVNKDNLLNYYLNPLLSFLEKKKEVSLVIKDYCSKFAKKHSIDKESIKIMKKIAKKKFNGVELSAIELELKEELHFLRTILYNQKPEQEVSISTKKNESFWSPPPAPKIP